MKLARIYFDGGAVPNPGKAYGSYEISMDNNVLEKKRIELGGPLSCNQAEYITLIEAITALRAMNYLGPVKLEIWSDSMLVVQQMRRKWKCKHPNMKVLNKTALNALVWSPFNWQIFWNPRSVNVEKFGH